MSLTATTTTATLIDPEQIRLDIIDVVEGYVTSALEQRCTDLAEAGYPNTLLGVLVTMTELQVNTDILSVDVIMENNYPRVPHFTITHPFEVVMRYINAATNSAVNTDTAAAAQKAIHEIGVLAARTALGHMQY